MDLHVGHSMGKIDAARREYWGGHLVNESVEGQSEDK
jgi:hypothetical protein